jgi:hypothetical protein
MDAKGGMRLHRLFDAVVSRVWQPQKSCSLAVSICFFSQGTPVAERTEFFRDYTWIGARQPLDISEQILYYSGTSSMPEWIDDEKGKGLPRICVAGIVCSSANRGIQNVVHCQGRRFKPYEGSSPFPWTIRGLLCFALQNHPAVRPHRVEGSDRLDRGCRCHSLNFDAFYI